MTAPTDRELVLSIRQGHTEAYSLLVERYQQAVFGVCYRMFGERRDAEDMTQEALIRGYQRLDRFDSERPFGPWIRKVAFNLCLNKIKARKPEPFELDLARDRQAGRQEELPEPQIAALERAEQIRAALNELPAPFKAAIELRHFQHLDYQEMAEVLKLPLNTVKSHLFRARKQLAALLVESGLKETL
jgi:RNA polymerase sigma-70 factor (ECF subfamily)